MLYALAVAPLHALPEIKSNKSLGTWEQFVATLGLQEKPGAYVYFDTDRLVAGEYVQNDVYDVFAKENRVQLRTNVGRIVEQKDGPDIVVYDFDEIYTALGPPEWANLPSTIYIFGRRPAAIVADGQISNWPYGGPALDVAALNSCDANDTDLRFDAGIGRGGDGTLRSVSYEDPYGGIIWHYYVSQGGGGGYGSAGQAGYDVDPAPGGAAGGLSYSWNVLRPGSPGGGSYVASESGDYVFRPHRGGLGGGAVWVKSGGHLDLGSIDASGWAVEGGACGSGGHVIIESPEIPQVASIRVSGGDPTYAHAAGLPMPMGHGGVGVVEFRGTPAPPKLTYLYGAKTFWIGSGKTPVGLPIGVTSMQNPYEETMRVEWPTGWNSDSTEPEYQIVGRPRTLVPAVTASAPRVFTNAQKFGVAASVTAADIPASLRYRVRPPGATFFGSWTAESLSPSSRKAKTWRKEFASGQQGRWQVEVVADDAKGGRSAGKVVEVLVDRIKPECYTPTNDAVEQTVNPGRYLVKVFAQDSDSSGVGTDASGPARIEYRTKRPGSRIFGRWTRFLLGTPEQYPDWPYAELELPITLNPRLKGDWTVEMRAVDRAGNIGAPTSITITQ